MIMLLLKGARGLYCSDNIRFYFPDRSWSDASPCLIKDFDIVKDKGNYAFIKASPLSTEPINNFDIGYNEDVRKITLDTAEFLLSLVVSYAPNMGFHLYYKQDGKVYKETVRSTTELIDLYNSAKPLSCDLVKYYSETCKLDTEDRYNNLIIHSLSKLSTVFKTDLHIINNCFLRVTKSFTFGGSKSEEFYCLTQDNILVDLGSSFANKLNNKIKSIKEVDMQSINRLIREIGLASELRGTSVTFSDKICRVDINKDNIHISIYAFKINKFDYVYYNSEDSALDRKIVQASLEAYDKMIKNIGKKLSGKNAVAVLKELSLKNNLL